MNIINNADRLQRYSELGLGLVRNNTVQLAAHNPRWKRAFSDESYLIQHQLKIASLRLYHCGSTSVSNISAKPIIDIAGSVKSLEELDAKKEQLESLGYSYKGECGIPGRRYCALYDEENSSSFFHLHFFNEDSGELIDHINFRDFLRTYPNVAAEYEAFKTSLNLPRDKYTEAKAPVISSILNRARENFKPSRTKSILAILGAAKGHQKTLGFLKDTYRDADVRIVDLGDLRIAPYSYDSSPKDDFESIVRAMIDADEVVLATPVYWYSMSSEMKIFIDRFSNLLRGELKSLGEELYGTKVNLLSTGSDLELPNGFENPFALTATYFGMDFMKSHYRSTQHE